VADFSKQEIYTHANLTYVLYIPSREAYLPLSSFYAFSHAFAHFQHSALLLLPTGTLRILGGLHSLST
jgi:hypothetical protein